MDGARKRRKWDVAAPGGMPLSGNRAGIGSGTVAKKQGLSGFITAQGLQIDLPEAPAAAAPIASLPVAPAPKFSEQEIIERAQQEAQAVVERINAQARAKGQMPASRGQSRFPDDAEKVFREVIINDAPQNIRFELIKRSVQDDIQRRTHTIVVIKGRYQQIPIPNDQEGPLRLRVMPGNVGPDDMLKQRAVDNGAQEIRRILQGGNSRHLPQQGPAAHQPSPGHAPPPDRLSGFPPAGGQQASLLQLPPLQTPSMQQPPQPAPAPWQQPAQSVSLYVGVEAPPEFNVIFKLRGPGDSYLQHISSTTGAEVTLRGRGAGGLYDSHDHLHMVVTANNPKSFEEAKGLSVNLIDTVRAEHAKFVANLPPTAAQQQLPVPSHAPQQQMEQPASMPMHSQAPAQSQQHSAPQLPPSPANQPPSPAKQPPAPTNQPPRSPGSRPPGGQLQQPAGPTYQQSQGGYPGAHQAPENTAALQYPAAGGYPQQYAAYPGSAPQPVPDSRSQPPHGMMHQPAGLPYSSQASAPSMLPQAGQQHMPNYPPSAAYPPQNVAYPPAVYGGRPAGRGTPYGARPGFANMAPGYQPQGSQYPPQQQQGAYGQGPPPAHALGPVHGPQRPPNMSPDMAAGSLQDPRDNRPEQNERHRPQQNGMSASDLQAQQERKRRFTEKSAKNGWKQGTTQQPVMPDYANQLPMPRPAAPPADPNPPLPMGPPPPRPPVQFKLGAMGPPPPRFNIRMQGPPQGASSGPVQGLVPYGGTALLAVKR